MYGNMYSEVPGMGWTWSQVVNQGTTANENYFKELVFVQRPDKEVAMERL